jgi:hypothetical protein
MVRVGRPSPAPFDRSCSRSTSARPNRAGARPSRRAPGEAPPACAVLADWLPYAVQGEPDGQEKFVHRPSEPTPFTVHHLEARLARSRPPAEGTGGCDLLPAPGRPAHPRLLARRCHPGTGRRSIRCLQPVPTGDWAGGARAGVGHLLRMPGRRHRRSARSSGGHSPVSPLPGPDRPANRPSKADHPVLLERDRTWDTAEIQEPTPSH